SHKHRIVHKRLSSAFDFVASDFSPAWRNWQTRWTQNPVAARPCGFEPLRRQDRQVFGFLCEQTAPAHGLFSVSACMKAGEPQCSLVNGKNGQRRQSEPREFVTT